MPDQNHPAFGVTDVLLLLMATIWGVNYSAVKYAGHVFGPLTFTWLRVLAAMITLLLVAAIQRKRWPHRSDALWLIALGIVGNGLYQLFFVFGVSHTRVGNAALIVSSAPAFIALISWMRGTDRLTPKTIGGIGLSIAGVGIVMLGTATASQNQGSLLGVMLVFCGVICWSVFTVAVQPFTIRVDTVQMNALTMVGGMIPLLLLTPFALARTAFAQAPKMGWVCVFYSAAISMGVAYLFWYRGLRVLGPTRTSVYGNLQPIVAILVGWGALGEAPTVWQIVGTVTIIGGLFLTRA